MLWQNNFQNFFLVFEVINLKKVTSKWRVGKVLELHIRSGKLDGLSSYRAYRGKFYSLSHLVQHYYIKRGKKLVRYARYFMVVALVHTHAL